MQLYTSAVADAVLEGKAAAPHVTVGADEFVEMDADGNPIAKDNERRKQAPRGKPPAKRGAPPAGRRSGPGKPRSEARSDAPGAE